MAPHVTGDTNAGGLALFGRTSFRPKTRHDLIPPTVIGNHETRKLQYKTKLHGPGLINDNLEFVKLIS